MNTTSICHHFTTYTLAGTLGIWATATVLSQFDIGRKTATKIDKTGLMVPDWRFFAPNPACHEIRLVYRSQLPNGDVTNWQELTYSQKRRFTHLIWAPHRRLEKGLFDATDELVRTHESTQDFQRVKLSTAYLTLLNTVTHKGEHPQDSVRTQFMLMRATSYEPRVAPEPVLVSDFHNLEAGMP
ncbi:MULTISPECIES: DUF5819 family protein [Auritidibacter]|uniref:DUF5819 family protein n=1 Tax=Auritidibacter TaxID=1160973 RepID=UPI000D7319EC|nr:MULTISPECIES: DUF5819 family protein [Auritidibacter]PXA76675.1 hypothetical protein DCC24_06445 [Auritidibacter sp. NML100628]PXA82324.1 hypothetical protein DCC26_00745 [Auritidibacter sp. NML120779]WHS27069.1 hypothetical protein QM395_06535 [Auritidibacter ignavus]WHS34046.1 hypothetical protein QM403_06615 [Auritidibacter ignavus]